ncbi:Os05g0220975 [Oryza sativa Japonica Group]|uniref:Os05g0220975 protein n=1 Tax=Oryza sativa subsp. japonica TaxID=39947 RepID=A0A0P0WJE0_ORYSJ|nr:Os05g0220975 [Oryza sativa Japonica Group]
MVGRGAGQRWSVSAPARWRFPRYIEIDDTIPARVSGRSWSARGEGGGSGVDGARRAGEAAPGRRVRWRGGFNASGAGEQRRRRCAARRRRSRRLGHVLSAPPPYR